MSLHLACSYINLHPIQIAGMEFHKLACRAANKKFAVLVFETFIMDPKNYTYGTTVRRLYAYDWEMFVQKKDAIIEIRN